MIITKTPFRMSFFGGGTDVADFFDQYGGSVISTTFDKYVYVTVRHLPRFFEYRDEIIYSKTERVVRIDDIEHPMVRNAMKMLDMHELHISYDADLPARTGLGTSSTFAVGLLNAFYALKGKYASKDTLAKDAIYLERELCKEAGGWQDQIAASFGGFNRIDFQQGSFAVKPIVISPERQKTLDDNLLLFFTGFTRFSFEVQKQTFGNIDSKVAMLNQMKVLVDEAEKILLDPNADLDTFGTLLGKEWEIKRSLSGSVSSSDIDALYKCGIESGALGGKILGAGGGGFLLFYCPLQNQERLRAALHDYMEVPFSFERGGSRVVYYAPEVFDKTEGILD